MIKNVYDNVLVFDAHLDKDGLLFIPEEVERKAIDIATKVGRKVLGVEGNFDEIRFVLDSNLTVDEAERILMKQL